jgi:hypothetical protein
VTERLCMLLVMSLFLTESCSMGPQSTKRELGRMEKVAPELRTLYEEYSMHVAGGRSGVFQPSSQVPKVIDGRVVIDTVATGDVEVLKSDLESLGMQRAVSAGRIVSGELPIGSIPAMGALRSLNFARAAVAVHQGGARY